MSDQNYKDAENGKTARVRPVAMLDRRICPGCGTENPESESTEYFCCGKCQWESDDGLPTLRGIMKGKFTNCGDVNLSKYLRTLMVQKNEP